MAVPYNFIRSKARPSVSEDEITAMTAQGRSPAYNSQGKVYGFNSRAGAPLSLLDTMHGLGIAGDIGTSEHDAAWNAWFHKTSSPSKSTTSAFDPNDDSGIQQGINPHVDPVGASIANNSNWLKSNGITTPLPPATNPMQFPNSSLDPARNKSAFAVPGATNPGYVNDVETYNARLYQPADTQQGTFAPQPAASNWNRTGWTAPTTTDSAAVAQRYATPNLAMNNWLKQPPI